MTIFVWKIDTFYRKIWRQVIAEKFDKFGYFYKTIWRFLQQNRTNFAWIRNNVIKTRRLAGNKNQQILLQNSSSFPEKLSNVLVKTVRLSCKNQSSEFPGRTVKFSCKSWRILLKKSSNFHTKIVKFSCKNRHIFSQRESTFLSKTVKIFRKNYQIFLLKLSTFSRKIERMCSIEWFQRTSIITCFKKF